jgi:hypothetical protein
VAELTYRSRYIQVRGLSITLHPNGITWADLLVTLHPGELIYRSHYLCVMYLTYNITKQPWEQTYRLHCIQVRWISHHAYPGELTYQLFFTVKRTNYTLLEGQSTMQAHWVMVLCHPLSSPD